MHRLITSSLIACHVASLSAQQPADTASQSETGTATVLVRSALLVAGSLSLDTRVHAFAAAHRTRTLDAAADVIDPLGRAGYIVPAFGAGYAVARVAGRTQLAAAVARIAAGYFAADAVGSILKPAVGRRRPGAGGAWQFRSLRVDESSEWHSFPSGHAVHALALAAGIAAEARRPWVSVVAYSAAGLVGLQRIYTGAHWPSDVVASGIIGVVAGTSTVRWLRRRQDIAEGRSRGARGLHLLLQPMPTGIVLGIAIQD